MRSAPLNYLVTAATGCLLWIATGILFGNVLGDRVVLQSHTTESFLGIYRGAVGVAALSAILSCMYWYFTGSKDTVSGKLQDARRRWTLLLMAQVVVAAVSLAVLAVILSGEGLGSIDYLLLSLVLLAQAPVFFWICTFLMSPRAVQFIPWGMR